MKIDYVKVSDVIGELTINVEESDYAEKVKKQLKELGKKRAEPGFRPGHVPAGLIEKKYGKAVKYEEINNLVGDAVFNYIKDNNLHVLGNPVPDKDNVVNDDSVNFTLKFTLGLAPDINVDIDKNMHIPYFKIKVTDEMVDRQDEALRRRFGKQEPGDEVDSTALVKGVITELNEDGTVMENGVVVENGIVAPQYFKSDEQRNLFIGKHVGDEIIFNPAETCDTNPAEMSSMLNLDKAEVQDHTGNFSFNVKEIIVLKPAELNEDYFKEAFGEDVKDEAGYREAVKNLIEASLNNDQNYRFTMDAQKVISNAAGKVELPDEILKNFLISRNENLNADNIDSEYDKIRDELVWDIIKDQIMSKLGVEVKEEDLRNTSKSMARNQFAQYGMTNVPEDAIEHYADQIMKDENSRESVARQTADMKLFGAIHNAVTLDEKEVSVDEFNELFRMEAEAANA